MVFRPRLKRSSKPSGNPVDPEDLCGLYISSDITDTSSGSIDGNLFFSHLLDSAVLNEFPVGSLL